MIQRTYSAQALFPDLHNIGGETTIEPDPVAGRNRANTCHATEDWHPYPTPVIAEVTRVDLSAEDGQDQGQHCQQVDLPPKLQPGEVTDNIKHSAIWAWGSPVSYLKGKGISQQPDTNVCAYSITIESVEDPRYIAAQDANRNACIVQRQPAAASLLRSMTREQVIPHWTQHANLRGKHTAPDANVFRQFLYV